MAVFGCPVCEIVIVQNAPLGTKVPCPVCAKPMVAKGGPNAPDIQFPQVPSRESVLDLELSDQLRKLIEKKGTKRTKK